MAKLTLTDITSGYGTATKINANNTLIENALENTLSRDGTSPNTMNADLDMNGNDIVNVGTISYSTGAVQLTDGVSAPATVAGKALIYVDTADGDLKIKFGDGTVKTIVTDTP